MSLPEALCNVIELLDTTKSELAEKRCLLQQGITVSPAAGNKIECVLYLANVLLYPMQCLLSENC